MSKVRIIGIIKRNRCVNRTHEKMARWLSRFDGCLFRGDDWEQFIQLVNNKARQLMDEAPSPNHIELHSYDTSLALYNRNGNRGIFDPELCFDVMEVRSSYNAASGTVEPYIDFKDDQEQEGGEV